MFFQILPSPKSRNGVRGSVLACSLADPGEVKQSLAAGLQ